MRKHSQNIIIDLVLFINLLFLMVTGLIMNYILPAGSRAKEFIHLTRHEWGDVHFLIGSIFTLLIFVHLTLHFKWIKGSIGSRSKKERS